MRAPLIPTPTMSTVLTAILATTAYGCSGGGGERPRCLRVRIAGGMAHQESFDPKPFAPIEYRGELKPIDTKIAFVRSLFTVISAAVLLLG